LGIFTKKGGYKKMKNIIFLGCVILFAVSCKAQTIVPIESKIDYIIAENGIPNDPIIEINDSIKEKYEALNDCFDTQIKDKSQEVIIMKEKVNTNMTLKLLKINDIWALDSSGIGKKDEIFYKEEDWEKLRKQNGNSSLENIENAQLKNGKCCWKSTDFKFNKINFEELEIGKREFEKKYMTSPSYDLYLFSDPIYYKNKEYIIFTAIKGSLAGFGSTVRLIIMKRIKNKWIQSYEGIPDWHS
jgi:hypothetical protein